MAIPEDILKKIKCCISNPQHYVNQPIMMNCCASNACKTCIQILNEATFKCICGKVNKKVDYINAITNEGIEMLKSLFILPLLRELDEKLFLAESSLTEDSMLKTYENKIEKIKDDLEIRSCSLQLEIEHIKNDYLNKLDEHKKKMIILIRARNEEQEKDIKPDSKNEELHNKQKKLDALQIKLEKYKQMINKMNFIPAKINFLDENYGVLEICDEEKQPVVAPTPLSQIAINPKLQSFIDGCPKYKIIDATKIQTKLPNEYKETIKAFLSRQLNEVDLTTLFANLDNDRVPKIFENLVKNKATIEKYKLRDYFNYRRGFGDRFYFGDRFDRFNYNDRNDRIIWAADNNHMLKDEEKVEGLGFFVWISEGRSVERIQD